MAWIIYITRPWIVNTLRPRQNGRHFPDNIFKWIFVKENAWIPIKISAKFVPMGPINNIPSLVQMMAWHGPGAKPLSETMMASSLLTHICLNKFNSVIFPHYLPSMCRSHQTNNYTTQSNSNVGRHTLQLLGLFQEHVHEIRNMMSVLKNKNMPESCFLQDLSINYVYDHQRPLGSYGIHFYPLGCTIMSL